MFAVDSSGLAEDVLKLEEIPGEVESEKGYKDTLDN